MDEATDNLTPTTNGALPELVEVNVAEMRLSPNELRALKAMTGRTMDDLMGENADEADRLQAMVWVELRRQGYTATWDQAGDVGMGFSGAAPTSDPTPTLTTPPLPGSAVSGA